jgi:hypothetical protein
MLGRDIQPLKREDSKGERRLMLWRDVQLWNNKIPKILAMVEE